MADHAHDRSGCVYLGDGDYDCLYLGPPANAVPVPVWNTTDVTTTDDARVAAFDHYMDMS